MSNWSSTILAHGATCQNQATSSFYNDCVGRGSQSTVVYKRSDGEGYGKPNGRGVLVGINISKLRVAVMFLV